MGNFEFLEYDFEGDWIYENEKVKVVNNSSKLNNILN